VQNNKEIFSMSYGVCEVDMNW